MNRRDDLKDVSLTTITCESGEPGTEPAADPAADLAAAVGANAAAAAAALGEPDAAEADGEAGSCAAGGDGAAAGTCAAGGLGRAAKGSACVCEAGNKSKPVHLQHSHSWRMESWLQHSQSMRRR